MNEEQIKALLAQLIADGGFMTKTDLNGTAAMIRGLKESLDEMKSGANPLDVLVTAGILQKDDKGQFVPKVVTAPPVKKADVEPDWQVQIRKMQEQIDAKDKALVAANTQREASELKSAVISAFEKAGALNPSRDYIHVLPSVKRAEDGSFHTISKDEAGVETQVPLDQAFGTFLKNNVELLKATGHAGSGTPVGSTAAAQGPVTTQSYMASRSKDLASGDIKITF